MKHGPPPVKLPGWKSRPARGAWIETSVVTALRAVSGSRPARGAWIETIRRYFAEQNVCVAPRAGRVD